MTPQQLRHSALNLRTRAKTQANAERAAAWSQEADELEAQAAKIEKQSASAPAAAAKK